MTLLRVQLDWTIEVEDVEDLDKAEGIVRDYLDRQTDLGDFVSIVGLTDGSPDVTLNRRGEEQA